MKRHFVWFGLLVSLVFIILLFRNLNWGEVFTSLTMLNNWHLLAVGVVIQLASYWVRAARWSVMMRGIKRIKTSRLFPVVCISYMANNTLPLRIGELVRTYHVGEKEGISKSSALSTIVIERIYDGLALLLILGITLLVYPFPSWVRQIGIAAFLFFSLALLFILLVILFRTRMMRFTSKMTSRLPVKIGNLFDRLLGEFINGLEVIREKRTLVPIVLYSLLIWVMEANLFYLISLAYGFDNALILSFFALVIVNLGIMIPSSPGYIGTFEYFVTRSLLVFGIVKEVSMGFAFILRITQYIPITILGFVFLITEGLSMKELIKLKDVSRESSEAH